MARSEASYHHGNLRQALVEAAEALVARDGARGISLRAIAREAGVSPAAPYHHFDSREGLLAAVATAGFRTLREALLRGGSGPSGREGPLAALQEAGVAYVVFAVDHPEVFRLMFSGVVSDREEFPELKEASDQTWAVLRKMLGAEPGRTDGSFPAVALTTWSTVHGLAFLLIEGVAQEETKGRTTDEIAREVTRVLGRGLGAYSSTHEGGGTGGSDGHEQGDPL